MFCRSSKIAKLGVAACVIALSAPSLAGSFAYAELDSNGQITSDIAGEDEPGALYEAGSIGKFVCTLAALRLADRGVLSIDDTIGQLLPRFADTAIAPIKLRDVLASRSAISDGLLPALQADPQAVMSTPDAATAVERYATGDLNGASGSRWSYDLVNWVVVQAVIEKQTDRPIASVMDELVIQPAGLGDSRVFVRQIGPGAQTPASPPRPLPGFLTCAGGLASTPRDLIALARFPHKGGLTAGSLEQLTTITAPEEGYTLGGRFLQTSAGQLLSWQSGSNGAYKSVVTYDPSTDTGFAAMTASGSNESIQAARTEWMERRTR
ncbi:serine hydrolase domain-containing protein [Erythrobacter ani]|uniref:Beta-lactamase family protein n=1 Tax=Erythrobacter ani TaxID=2827235 RepID=A0ABS6SJW7_9SPHN|nr:serine hydrolase domain-containing protein [Erythrobacter ani]MBV7265301.1 beta-lactamase family protein [Erythrobacter ani]